MHTYISQVSIKDSIVGYRINFMDIRLTTYRVPVIYSRIRL